MQSHYLHAHEKLLWSSQDNGCSQRDLTIRPLAQQVVAKRTACMPSAGDALN